MSLYGIEHNFEGERGQRPLIELTLRDADLLLRATIKVMAGDWLTQHPYSRVAKRIANQKVLEIKAEDAVRLVRAVEPKVRDKLK